MFDLIIWISNNKNLNKKSPKFKVGDIVEVKSIPSLWYKITHIYATSSLIKYEVWPEWHFFREEELELYRWDIKKESDENKIIYKQITKLIARLQIDYDKYYNDEVTKEELKKSKNWYSQEYIFFPDIKVEVTDWEDWIFIEVNWEEIKWNPFSYPEDIQAEILLPYIIKNLLKYLKKSEYDRMSLSWQETLDKILKRKITNIRNKKDIGLLKSDCNSVFPTWQEILNIISKYLDYIKFENVAENIKFYPLDAHRKNRTNGTLIELSDWFKGAEVQMKDWSIIVYVLYELKNEYGKYQTWGDSIWVYDNENSNTTKEDILNDFKKQLYKNYKDKDKIININQNKSDYVIEIQNKNDKIKESGITWKWTIIPKAFKGKYIWDKDLMIEYLLNKWYLKEKHLWWYKYTKWDVFVKTNYVNWEYFISVWNIDSLWYENYEVSHRYKDSLFDELEYLENKWTKNAT